MRILTVVITSVLFLSACSSDTRYPYTSSTGTGYTQTGTGTGYTYADPSVYDPYGYGTGDDLPSGTFQALFGWANGDYSVFLGMMIDPNNSYSACNPYTYGNPARQDSWRNQGLWSNPYSDIGAYNPAAQHPPTMWNYNTDTGAANFIGYVRKNAQIDPDALCR